MYKLKCDDVTVSTKRWKYKAWAEKMAKKMNDEMEMEDCITVHKCRKEPIRKSYHPLPCGYCGKKME